MWCTEASETLYSHLEVLKVLQCEASCSLSYNIWMDMLITQSTHNHYMINTQSNRLSLSKTDAPTMTHQPMKLSRTKKMYLCFPCRHIVWSLICPLTSYILKNVSNRFYLKYNVWLFTVFDHNSLIPKTFHR